MRHLVRRTISTFLLAVFALSQLNCTKEKAEAIKTGAEQFRVEAKAAIAQIRSLEKQDRVVIFTSSDQEAKSLANNFQNVTQQGIPKFVDDNLARNQRLVPPATEFEKHLSQIEEAYDVFGSMFRSLPRGNFLAKNAVKKSKVFAIKLTLEMVNLSKLLGEAPFRFSGRRQNLMDQFLAAQKITDPTAN